MVKVFTNDGVDLGIEITTEQAERARRQHPRIIRGSAVRLVVRMGMKRLNELIEQAYSAETASLKTHYKTMFESGRFCWSQKRVDENGQLVRWDGERTPTWPRMAQAAG